VKWIIVSPHCASCNGNYAYPQLQYTIPYLLTAYRVDTSCVWVGGLSAGGAATWSVVMGQQVGDTALGKRLAGIMPISNGGYDNYIGTLGGNLDSILKRGLGVLTTIGSQDQGYNPLAFGTYWTHVKTNDVPGYYYDSIVAGGIHNSVVWNPPFPETARIWSKTMNSWTQMWTLRRKAVTATPPPPTNPPTVSAGTNQNITLPSTLTLTGTATANGGTTISGYTWSQQSGPNTAAITTAGAAITTVTGVAAGTYVFKLIVTASDGSSSTSTVTVVVTGATPPANTAPMANAGTNQVITLPTASASLTGSGTDADGNSTIASYGWTQVSGPNTAGITTAAVATTTVTGLIQGVYVFRLTVTDDQSATGTADVQVTVNAAGNASSAYTWSDGGDEGSVYGIPGGLDVFGQFCPYVYIWPLGSCGVPALSA